MRISRLGIVCGLALGFTALSPTFALASERPRPLKGIEIGTNATANLATFDASVDGYFRISHLGKGTFHEDTVATPRSLNQPTFSFTGTDTLIAANGDRVFTSDAGFGRFTSIGTEVLARETIIGGTGRFRDASGVFTLRGVSRFVSLDGQVATATTIATVQGRISY